MWDARLFLPALLLACAVGGGAAATADGAPFAQLNATEGEVLAFINGLEGQTVLAGQPQYQHARNLTSSAGYPFNDKRPVMIVYCASEADVAAAITWAAQRKLPLCVRAGGHDTSGASICTGGVVVDVSPLDQVSVLPDEGQVVVGAGNMFQDLRDELALVGMGAVTGDCPTVGLAGYSLGGGWSWHSKEHGMGTDNILSLEVVLANGTSVTANATSHPDLFWAMRGAGHQNFGVATSIAYRAFPIKPRVPSYNVTFDVTGTDYDAAARALALWRNLYVDAPGMEHLVVQLFCSATMGDPGSKQMAFLAVLWQGSEADLEEMMQPLAALGDSAAGALVDNPEGVAALEDPLTVNIDNLQGAPAYWESKRGQYVTRALDVDEWRSVLDGIFSFPTFPDNYTGQAYMASYFEPYEGTMVSVPSDHNAFVHREAGFDLVLDLTYTNEPGAQDAALAWLASLYDDKWLGLMNGQAYQNYPSSAYSPQRALEMYFASNLPRLIDIKQQYDPTGVFAPEQGVPLEPLPSGD